MTLGNLSPETHTAEEVVRLLELEPLEQEGGYFRRSFESSAIARGDDRRAYSVIYFLVTPDDFSALHKLSSDEVWCFHCGDPLESLRLGPNGAGRMAKLGLNPAAGEAMQDVVPADIWQGTRLVAGGRWSLVSCMVAPEFRWTDFVLGERSQLTREYPAFAQEIAALTR